MDNCRMNYRTVPNRKPCPPAANNPCMQPREDTCPINANCLEQYPLAMGYIPRQKFNNVYDTCKALSRGTIFRNFANRSVEKEVAADVKL